MQVTLEWLKEYIEFDLDAEKTAHLLTMAGLEVEAIKDSELGPVLDVKVTPNRGDCLSIVGLAWEIMAKLGDQCTPTELWAEFRSGWSLGDKRGENEAAKLASVTIEDENLCPRYAARLVRGFSIGASSERLQKRLIACGMRPISNIVDVTNYVMIETGQPLHAFDHDKLAEGRIVVRQASPGEKITVIDGTECEVLPPMLMICDAKRPIAIAGVMGGADSEVSGKTTNMLLESAHFSPTGVRKTSKALGIRTEASYRFERSVDRDVVMTALNRAGMLIERETGVAPVRGFIDCWAGDDLPSGGAQFEVSVKRASALLGMEVDIETCIDYLSRLGLSLRPINDDRIVVGVPVRRPDLVREEDIIEEIGRIHGYEHIPDELPMGRTLLGKETPTTAFETAVRRELIGMGLTEVVNHSLRAPSSLDPAGETIGPRNPMSPELSILRPSLLLGLAASLLHNARRGNPDLALFEIGRVFEGMKEVKHLGIMLCGRRVSPNWQAGEKTPPHDFFTLKGFLETLLDRIGVTTEMGPVESPRFHPGRSACFVDLGIFGALSPDATNAQDLPAGTLAAELSMDALFERAKREYSYTPPPRFPAVRRDLAFEIAKSVVYATIEKAVRSSAGEALEDVRLFDVYEGKGIGEGNHSLAIALTLRKPDGTMTDEEANAIREQVFGTVEGLGARRR